MTGGHSTGALNLLYFANRSCGKGNVANKGDIALELYVVVNACVLTEEEVAILGYLANSAGVEDGQLLACKTMDGYLATGCCVELPETQQLSEYAMAEALVTAHCVALSIKLSVYPDERFPPNDIYLLLVRRCKLI
jgi:hypothetical protein